MDELRILKTIEGITFEDFAISSEKKVEMIYRFAHIGVGSCQNKHEDWLKECRQVEKSLIKMGII